MIDPRPNFSPPIEPESSSVPEPDTIVAISTPPGRGGVGVVRLSGARAIRIATSLFRPASGSVPGLVAGQAVFGRFLDADGEPIDHGYLILFRAPATFTGDETAELWAHGSPATLREIVLAAVKRGARPASPGEFTLRAFLNGRIDATQAEAIRDLIEARTAFQAKVAHDQIQGRISAEVDRLKDRLAELVARLEASIEFGEEAEADRFLPGGGLAPQARALRRDIEALAGTFDRGRLVREGARIALVGSPNVGKSSLFNRLLEEERAIVAPTAGTTRDLLEETLDLEGIPAALIDTAGLHEPRDEAESEAVRRAREALVSADLPVLVIDRSRPLNEDETRHLEALDSAIALVVLNKIDLDCGLALDDVLRLKRTFRVIEVSARTGQGMETLRRRLAGAIGSAAVASREEPLITNIRHYDLLLRAVAALGRAEEGTQRGVTDECLVLEYRDALDSLGEITGSIGLDGIYERIFRNFCIGK